MFHYSKDQRSAGDTRGHEKSSSASLARFDVHSADSEQMLGRSGSGDAMIRISPLIRKLVIFGACLLLSSCSVLVYRKNLIFAADSESTGGVDSASHIYLRQLPMSIIVQSNSKSRVLAFGPLFPIIPWLPGIFDVMLHKQKFGTKNEPVGIILGFWPASRTHAGMPTEFGFNPHDSRLVVGDKTFYPTSFSFNLPDNCSQESRVDKMSDGKYLITILSPSTSCINPHVQFNLTYDILASEITAARLYIENLTFQKNAVGAIAPIIERGPIIRME